MKTIILIIIGYYVNYNKITGILLTRFNHSTLYKVQYKQRENIELS